MASALARSARSVRAAVFVLRCLLRQGACWRVGVQWFLYWRRLCFCLHCTRASLTSNQHALSVMRSCNSSRRHQTANHTTASISALKTNTFENSRSVSVETPHQSAAGTIIRRPVHMFECVSLWFLWIPPFGGQMQSPKMLSTSWTHRAPAL